MQRTAILDLGTNTFHLLLFDIGPGKCEFLFKKKEFVKLASGSVDFITEEPYNKGLEVLKQYKAVIDEMKPDRIIAYGTAGLRRASNAAAFTEDAKELTGIQIQVISGDEEAALIAEGVRWAVPFQEKPYLIMDIGGGSVEFILANHNDVFFSKSYNIGAAVLLKEFHHSDPIAEEEVGKMLQYIETELPELFEACEKNPPVALAGASGSFDTIGEILFFPKTEDEFYEKDHHVQVTAADIIKTHDQLLKTTLEQRLKLQGLLPMRAELIVVSAVLIKFILEKFSIEKIYFSNYALKEGLLKRLMAGAKAFSC